MTATIGHPPHQEPEKKLTNRLILIGNGFDISHGHKTEFKDFILDYLTFALNSFTTHDNKYDDQLMNLSLKSYQTFHPSKVIETHEVLSIISKLKNNYSLQMMFKTKFSESLLEPVLNKNWVNIEAIYFEALLYEMKRSKKEHWKDSIGLLNNQLT